MKLTPTVPFLTVCVFLLVACSGGPAPVSRPELRRAPDVPLVFVPGILGTKVRERGSGKSLWGHGYDLVWPRDGGYEIAFPLSTEPWADDDRIGSDRVEPTEVVDQVNFLGYKRVVYENLKDLLERHGYRRGDQRDPSPSDTLFLFAYDFRRENVAIAQELFEFLERLEETRGEDILEIDLLCQSNGAHLCRYLTKYGDLTLEQALAGESERRTIRVRKLALVGTANGGALRVLRELHRGRRYLSTLSIGRHYLPETVFTFRSLFQELPAHDHNGDLPAQDLFIDQAGKSMDLDLYSARTWADYEWSAFRPDARRRMSRTKARAIFQDEKLRLEYLDQQLERARQFQMALARDAPGYEVDQILSIQNQDLETPRRALVERTEKGWNLIFAGDKAAQKLPVAIQERLHVRGDGHATVDSQNRLSSQELEILLPLHEVGGTHYGVIQEPEAHERLLEFFLSKE